MFRALWTAATGMGAQQMNVDVISNNLANVNTSGYKRTRVDFQDLFYQTIQQAGTKTTEQTETASGIQVGLGTMPVATQKIFTQGDFQSTENPLDLVIEGDGFFQVSMPDGTLAYTRSGALKKDGEGRIVTSDGFPLEPAITVPDGTTELAIGVDGTVSAKVTGSDEATVVGTIELARFMNPAGLMSMGRSLYTATSASGQAVVATPGTDGLGTLQQGYLETSNVKVVEEMVSMIMAQRAYEINSKVIKASDEMITMANNLTR